MKVLHAIGHGRVIDEPRKSTSAVGDQFVEFTIQFDERELVNRKRYAQRVKFRSFNRACIAQVESGTVTKGSFVLVDGECDAVAEQGRHGEWFANPRVTGRIQHARTP